MNREQSQPTGQPGPTYEATRPREVKLPEGTPLPGAVAAAV